MPRKLTDWIDSYIKYTYNSEPPELFHTWVAISTIASALERKCVINWGPLRFYPNMYIVLCAPPGKARKGTAMSYGESFLSRIGVKLAAESSSREALVRFIMDSFDATINEETGDIYHHSSVTIYSPELTVLLGYKQQQLMMDLTDWFDCGRGPEGRWTYRTKHQGVDEIIGIWVNLLGATTPDLLRSTLSLDAFGGGLTSRMIFVFEEDKRKSCPAPFLSKEEQRIGEDLYYDLEQIRILKGSFKPDSQFIDRWVEWYMSQDQTKIFDDPHLAPYCERRPVHIMKLSMILSAARGDSMILTVDDLNRAIGLLERTELKMPKTFSGIGKSPHAEVLSKVMAEIGMAGTITKSALMRKFYQDADDRVMEIIIETLRSMGFIDRKESGEDTILVYRRKKEVPV